MPQAHRTPCRRRPSVAAILVFALPVMAVASLCAATPPANGVVGRLSYHRITGQETLLEIARLYDLGYIELVAANPGIDPWLPEPGRTLLLPTAHLLPTAPPQGIVINLPELRLYYFDPHKDEVVTLPIGVGRAGRETPIGTTGIVRKRKDPTWIPPQSIRAERPELPAAVPPGPDNPLGKFALDLGWPSYVIHGTNRPYGIGRRVSSGCIRLYPEDIETLFDLVRVGTPVTVVDQPIKFGWLDGELFIEVHPSSAQGDSLEATGRFAAEPISDFEQLIRTAAGDQAGRVVWPIVEKAVATRRGIPVRVTQ